MTSVRTTPTLALALSLAGLSLPVVAQPVASLSAPPAQPTRELAERADRVAEAFRARRSRPARERWAGFVREGRSRVFSVGVASPRCLGFVAVGRERVEDLDLTVANDSGVEIARDDRRDAHPYVRVCPNAPTALHVRVAAVRGSGEVAVLTVADPPLVPPPLDETLGVRPANVFAGPRVARAEVGRDPAAVSAAELLARLTERLTAQGYRRTGQARAGRLEHQQSVQNVIPLEGGRCYVVQGAGGDRVDDLDLRVLSPERRPLGQDTGLDARPAVRFCATAGGSYPVDVRMYSGSGEWAFEVMEVPPDVANRLGPDVRGVERARALEVAGEAARRRMEPAGDAVRGAAWAAAVLPVAVTLRAGRCYLFGAAGDEALVALDLWVSDPSGTVLGADTNERERAVVYHCSRRDVAATVQVRVHGGRGEYVFQMFESGGER